MHYTYTYTFSEAKNSSTETIFTVSGADAAFTFPVSELQRKQWYRRPVRQLDSHECICPLLNACSRRRNPSWPQTHIGLFALPYGYYRPNVELLLQGYLRPTNWAIIEL